jgi:GH24 family phage-related lysozyme (muramidase)
MAYLDDSIAQLKIFEDSVPWMYLDTNGYVTVGVGEMLPNAARAQSLGFVDINNQPATSSAILNEYQRVSALPPAETADFYCSPTSPTLPPATIDAILLQHLTYFDGQLQQRFASYPNFPDPAKLGLLDMIFNLGPAKLFNTYPKFMGYVQNQDWANAALECYRNGPSAERNDWTKQQFLAAAAAVAAG